MNNPCFDHHKVEDKNTIQTPAGGWWWWWWADVKATKRNGTEERKDKKESPSFGDTRNPVINFISNNRLKHRHERVSFIYSAAAATNKDDDDVSCFRFHFLHPLPLLPNK